jgi:hypothetical protein
MAGGAGAGAVLILSVALSGCGTVLTKAQTDVIQSFAHANETYAKLPASVLRSYEDVHFATRVLDASAAGKQDPSRSLGQIEGAVRFWQEVESKAVQLDAALQIFDRYTALLARLSSDNLVDLDGAATDLGGAFAASVDAYNSLPAAKTNPLPSVGSDVAAVARAVGGVFIKNRQLAYLREFVQRADPVICKLSSDIKSLAATFTGPDGSFVADAKDIENTFKIYVSDSTGTVGAADFWLFAEALRKEALALTLAEHVRDASTKLASSHKALAGVLAPKPSLAEARSELSTLIEQLQAASTVKSKLDALNK